MGRLEGSSHVQFKFKSANEFDTLWFDGEGISLNDLKARILEQKKMVPVGRGGKIADFDLAISNAQTGDEYSDYSTLVPRNTALVVRRVPPHRKLTLASKRGTTELGLQGEAGDAADADADLPSAAADAAVEVVVEPAPAAESAASTELALLIARELVCPLCAELYSSAVVVSCCGDSFCDGCLQLRLQREGKCPACAAVEGTFKVLPNKQLRQTVGRHRERFPNATAPPRASRPAAAAYAAGTAADAAAGGADRGASHEESERAGADDMLVDGLDDDRGHASGRRQLEREREPDGEPAGGGLSQDRPTASVRARPEHQPSRQPDAGRHVQGGFAQRGGRRGGDWAGGPARDGGAYHGGGPGGGLAAHHLPGQGLGGGAAGGGFGFGGPGAMMGGGMSAAQMQQMQLLLLQQQQAMMMFGAGGAGWMPPGMGGQANAAYGNGGGGYAQQNQHQPPGNMRGGRGWRDNGRPY
jgi:hypothetical protein